MVPLFEDPDQTVDGCGPTPLRGAHHAVEKFFRMQRDTNGHLGPEATTSR